MPAPARMAHLRVSIPLALKWSPLGDSLALYPRGFGVRLPPIVSETRGSTTSQIEELFIEDICSAG